MEQSTTIATAAQIETIRSRAYNETARHIEQQGVRLSWNQEEELGEEATAWLLTRLGLYHQTDADGVTYLPSVE